MDRRDAMRWMVRGIGAATAAGVGGPALLTLLSPVVRNGGGSLWRPLGRLDAFPVGEIRQGVIQAADDEENGASRPAFTSQVVFVWRPDADQTIVYSRACTDLGCPVTHDPGNDWFYCPCHGGIFNQQGQPVAGPPKYPLYRYRTRVRGDILEVDVHSVPPMT